MTTTLLALLFGMAVFTSCRSNTFLIPSGDESKLQRIEISRITQIKPHDEIRRVGESELISHQAITSNMSSTEFVEFLVALDKIKLHHIEDGLRSLRVFHDLSVPGHSEPTHKQDPDPLQIERTQSSELATIQSQVLLREIAALQAWKPGLTAEQCLSIADSGRSKGDAPVPPA